MWCLLTIILAHGKLRQEDCHGFEASLGCIVSVRSDLKEETNEQPPNNKHGKKKIKPTERTEKTSTNNHNKNLALLSNDDRNCKIYKTPRNLSFDWLLDAVKELLLLKV